MSEENKTNCLDCTSAIWCETWAEVKCKVHERRIYGYKTLTDCKFYKKRPKGFKEPQCQCEDCLKNELLIRDDEEEN